MQLYLTRGDIPCHSEGAQRLKNLGVLRKRDASLLQHDRLDSLIKSENDRYELTLTPSLVKRGKRQRAGAFRVNLHRQESVASGVRDS
jgi:hypothetical protein